MLHGALPCPLPSNGALCWYCRLCACFSPKMASKITLQLLPFPQTSSYRAPDTSFLAVLFLK